METKKVGAFYQETLLNLRSPKINLLSGFMVIRMEEKLCSLVSILLIKIVLLLNQKKALKLKRKTQKK